MTTLNIISFHELGCHFLQNTDFVSGVQNMPEIAKTVLKIAMQIFRKKSFTF